jgi:hypothetical protein
VQNLERGGLPPLSHENWQGKSSAQVNDPNQRAKNTLRFLAHTTSPKRPLTTEALTPMTKDFFFVPSGASSW